MDFNTAATQILILFIIMFIGIAAKRKKVIDDKMQDSMSVLLMKIALPALILSSTNFERTDDVLSNTVAIFLVSVACYLVMIFIGTLAAKGLGYGKKTANVFISLLVFGNVGFMGYPMARAFFAELGVFYTSIVNLVFTCFLWTYGILLFDRNEKINFRKLLNIGSISSFIALFMFFTNLKFPYILQAALDHIGKTTAPLSMLLIGALIAEIDISKLVSDKKVYIVSIIKLIIVPCALAYALKLAGFNSMVISICTVMAAMPSGATNAIFANQFDSEPQFASIGVFITTLLSIITLPLTVYMLTNFIL